MPLYMSLPLLGKKPKFYLFKGSSQLSKILSTFSQDKLALPHSTMHLQSLLENYVVYSQNCVLYSFKIYANFLR